MTIELAKKAKEDEVKHFVYIRSLTIYVMTPSLNIAEGIVTEKTIYVPNSDYEKSELEAETGLHKLESDDFIVSIIRILSIYSEKKLDYFGRHYFLVNKFKSIPLAFRNRCCSEIYTENLCELIRLIIDKSANKTYCPDDRKLSTMNYCSMIAKYKCCSMITGIVAKTVLRTHSVVISCFGEILYDDNLISIFNAKYTGNSRKD